MSYWIIHREQVTLDLQIEEVETKEEADKKTGKLSYYTVTVTDHRISNCECKARQFKPYVPCKHMERLNENVSTYDI